jgi:hypothetical protein
MRLCASHRWPCRLFRGHADIYRRYGLGSACRITVRQRGTRRAPQRQRHLRLSWRRAPDSLPQSRCLAPTLVAQAFPRDPARPSTKRQRYLTRDDECTLLLVSQERITPDIAALATTTICRGSLRKLHMTELCAAVAAWFSPSSVHTMPLAVRTRNTASVDVIAQGRTACAKRRS